MCFSMTLNYDHYYEIKSKEDAGKWVGRRNKADVHDEDVTETHELMGM